LSPSRWIHHIAVCEHCGQCCALDAGAVVHGTGAHADTLTADELKTLRTHRRPFLRRA